METVESLDELVERLVEQLDEWLALTGQRDLFSAEDVQDRLLDLRVGVNALKESSN